MRDGKRVRERGSEEGSNIEGRGSRVESRGSRVEDQGSRYLFEERLVPLQRRQEIVVLFQTAGKFVITLILTLTLNLTVELDILLLLLQLAGCRADRRRVRGRQRAEVGGLGPGEVCIRRGVRLWEVRKCVHVSEFGLNIGDHSTV